MVFNMTFNEIFHLDTYGLKRILYLPVANLTSNNFEPRNGEKHLLRFLTIFDDP